MIKTQKELKNCLVVWVGSPQDKEEAGEVQETPIQAWTRESKGNPELCNKLHWGKSTCLERSVMEVIFPYCVGFTYFVDVGGEDQIDMWQAKSLRGKSWGKRTHSIGQQGLKSKNDP